MPKQQNVSTPAGNPAQITCLVETDDPDETLTGSTVVWRVYPQAVGAPLDDSEPLIMKSSPDGGIEILESPPMAFVITLTKGDTLELLGNYYHEGTVVDVANNPITIVLGVFTVTQAINIT